ncbi:hypothetical protein Tco_1412010, partial [Tanacetum coccineum]
VLALENTNTSQAVEIATLKERIKKLEKKKSLGAQEDASKQGRKIADIDADAEVTLVDETQGMNDDNLMFDTSVLDEQEVKVEKVKKVDSTAKVEVTTASATTITLDELNLAQTLIEIKAAKPKAVTTAVTIITPASTRSKAKGIVKDKGKAKMIEEEPVKKFSKKEQIRLDEEFAFKIQAEEQEEERIAREKAQKIQEANLAWDDIQATVEVDY